MIKITEKTVLVLNVIVIILSLFYMIFCGNTKTHIEVKESSVLKELGLGNKGYFKVHDGHIYRVDEDYTNESFLYRYDMNGLNKQKIAKVAGTDQLNEIRDNKLFYCGGDDYPSSKTYYYDTKKEIISELHDKCSTERKYRDGYLLEPVGANSQAGFVMINVNSKKITKSNPKLNNNSLFMDNAFIANGAMYISSHGHIFKDGGQNEVIYIGEDNENGGGRERVYDIKSYKNNLYVFYDYKINVYDANYKLINTIQNDLHYYGDPEESNDGVFFYSTDEHALYKFDFDNNKMRIVKKDDRYWTYNYIFENNSKYIFVVSTQGTNDNYVDIKAYDGVNETVLLNNLPKGVYDIDSDSNTIYFIKDNQIEIIKF